MTRFIIFLGIGFGFFGFALSRRAGSNCYSDLTDLITRDGFYAEEHKITTEDGYILTAHRVLKYSSSNTADNNGTAYINDTDYNNTAYDNTDYNNDPTDDDREVVILLHGLFFSSADWLLLGSDNALPYLLANKGYDVWLLNFRGNDYSENHTSQNPNTSSDYWNFSWHEMGLYDIPATVNYTTNQTGQDNVTLICYSQGCSAAFVAGIYNPNITDQIKFTSAMAPGVYMGNTQYQNVKWMAMSEFPLKMKAEGTRYRKFKPYNFGNLANRFCSNFEPELCEMISMYGFDLGGANRSIISTLSCYTPSGVSMKQIMHYLQLVNCNCFRQYDYGLPKNLAEYSSFYPPNYDLRQVKFPVSVYSGTNDKMVVPTDARRTANELGNLVAVHSVPVGHYDFLYGNNARQAVYEPLIEELENYQPVQVPAPSASYWFWG